MFPRDAFLFFSGCSLYNVLFALSSSASCHFTRELCVVAILPFFASGLLAGEWINAIPMAKDDDLSNCLQSLWKISKEITKLIPSSDGPNFINDLATCRRRVGGGVSNCLLWS